MLSMDRLVASNTSGLVGILHWSWCYGIAYNRAEVVCRSLEVNGCRSGKAVNERKRIIGCGLYVVCAGGRVAALRITGK